MENVTTSFVLLGLSEMEGLRYVYCAFSFIVYLFILGMSFMVVFVVMTEPSLHEPMYILICNLVLNGIVGSSSFFPKLLIDLFTSSKNISRDACFIQFTCITIYAYVEIGTFTIMAYDRYLAVCHPLKYVTLMTNDTVLKFIFGCLAFSVIAVSIGAFLTNQLHFCGTHIQNIFCDKMSLLVLSCTDSTTNKVHGEAVWSVYLSVTVSVIIFSYINILLICLKLSKESRKKAIHTMMTHLLGFSVFIMGVLFVFMRYRLNGIDLPITVHSLFSVIGLVTPPLFNPLIYGIRTKALKMKMIQKLQKFNLLMTFRYNISSHKCHVKTLLL